MMQCDILVKLDHTANNNTLLSSNNSFHNLHESCFRTHPWALLLGPSRPVIRNCASGNMAPSMPIKGMLQFEREKWNVRACREVERQGDEADFLWQPKSTMGESCNRRIQQQLLQTNTHHKSHTNHRHRQQQPHHQTTTNGTQPFFLSLRSPAALALEARLVLEEELRGFGRGLGEPVCQRRRVPAGRGLKLIERQRIRR